LQVEGSEVRINSTSRARNGSVSSLLMTLNVEAGMIGAWWIIPVNLNPGEQFYDAFIGQNITILGEEQLEYAGAVRTVTNTTVPGRIKHWDKATGVFLLSADVLPDYSINVRAFSTNLWSPQILGLEPAVFYAVVFVAAATIVAMVLLVFIWRRKK
jgi:hypothetical protein